MNLTELLWGQAMPSYDDNTEGYSGGRGGRQPFDIGNAFRDGRAEIMGRTEADGWKKEVTVRLPNGEMRKLDNARFRHGRIDKSVENKVAKRIKPSRELFDQIRKDVELAKNFGIESKWEMSGKIPKSVADALERANKESRGMVELVRVGRAERNAAFQRAHELARTKEKEQKEALARFLDRLRLNRERRDRAKERERAEREAHGEQRARGAPSPAEVARVRHEAALQAVHEMRGQLDRALGNQNSPAHEQPEPKQQVCAQSAVPAQELARQWADEQRRQWAQRGAPQAQERPAPMPGVDFAAPPHDPNSHDAQRDQEAHTRAVREGRDRDERDRQRGLGRELS
ncbi:hypothetical protein ACFVMC_08770 [Nocardia sp. NPDC127579]|uniref:hypothetical protein n=1 Tax=Nocardia sp. NPDC127579 TaxID=3345402 RepID=UPI00363BB670